MGGTVKNAAQNIGRGVSAVYTLGGSEIARNNLGQKNVLNQALNAPGSIATGGQSTYADPLNPGMDMSPAAQKAYTDFNIDPYQSGNDQSAINNLGQSQYDQILKGIDTNAAAQNDAAAKFFQASLPDIAENSNAAHLYDSTGYGQEVARQQALLANQVASKTADEKLGALSGLQGVQTGALQRGLSLEDFVNQANVAKSIGAQMAPQPPSGKQNFGTVASGIGALSPFAKLGKAGGGAAAAGAGSGAAAAIPAAAEAITLV